MLAAMATLVCSMGHPNPIGQRFCGACGEDLTVPNLDADAAPAEVVPVGTSRRARVRWITIAASVAIGAIIAIALAFGQRSNRSSPPSVTTVVRGDQTLVWYFPVATPDTETTSRVNDECAAHPEVGTIQVNFIDLDRGSLTPVDSKSYRCP